jgi:hypothetical protein
MSGSARGAQKPAAARRCGAARLLYLVPGRAHRGRWRPSGSGPAAARLEGRSAAEHPCCREGCPGLHAAQAQEAWGSRQHGSCRRWRARPLAAARELPEGRGRAGLTTREVSDMPQDRLACIVPTDGTPRRRGPCPPWVDDHAAALVQSVEDSDGNSSPPFAISLVPGKVENGGWSRQGSREGGLSRLLEEPRWFDRHPNAVTDRAPLPTGAGCRCHRLSRRFRPHRQNDGNGALQTPPTGRLERKVGHPRRVTRKPAAP